MAAIPLSTLDVASFLTQMQEEGYRDSCTGLLSWYEVETCSKLLTKDKFVNKDDCFCNTSVIISQKL